MGQYLNQRDNRTKLQQRLDDELRAKAAKRADGDNDRPDGVDDSTYIEHTKQTTSLGWAWLTIVILAIGLFGYFVYMVNVG